MTGVHQAQPTNSLSHHPAQITIVCRRTTRCLDDHVVRYAQLAGEDDAHSRLANKPPTVAWRNDKSHIVAPAVQPVINANARRRLPQMIGRWLQPGWGQSGFMLFH
jgi:hypothetical protein